MLEKRALTVRMSKVPDGDVAPRERIDPVAVNAIVMNDIERVAVIVAVGYVGKRVVDLLTNSASQAIGAQIAKKFYS